MLKSESVVTSEGVKMKASSETWERMRESMPL